MGRSLGSGVAVYVAINRKVARMILATPYDSIENVAQDKYPIFPIRILLKDKFESWRRAPLVRAATLVLIAGDDQVVPRSNSDRLIAQFRVRPDVVVIGQAGHNTISVKSGYAQAIRVFLADSQSGKTKVSIR